MNNETQSIMITRADFKSLGFDQREVNVVSSALHRYVPYAERRKIITNMTRKTSGSYQQITWAIHWNADDTIHTLETLCNKSDTNKTLFQRAIEKINHFKIEKISHFKSKKGIHEAITVAI